MSNTEEEFDIAIAECRAIFSKKLKDYNPSWRILRPESVTDQLLIKANRIRTLEVKRVSLVGEGIKPELIGLINYGIIGLIQLEKGYAEKIDMDAKAALELYDEKMQGTRSLMLAKNHDYDEAWRNMRTTSYTDLILTKIYRTKQIEDNNNETIISEGIDANYMDIINYAVFGLIKMNEEEKRSKNK